MVNVSTWCTHHFEKRRYLSPTASNSCSNIIRRVHRNPSRLHVLSRHTFTHWCYESGFRSAERDSEKEGEWVCMGAWKEGHQRETDMLFRDRIQSMHADGTVHVRRSTGVRVGLKVRELGR